MPLTVAIVGRPNVGKSTLFNRLVGRRQALTDETPGVTRDWREGQGRLGRLEFLVIDTAGLEDADAGTLQARMMAQTARAVAAADVVLMLVDARAGVTPLDQHFASWVRKTGRATVLAANKCEGRAGEDGFLDAYGLGLGEPVAISAEHAEGMADLEDALAEAADAVDRPAASAEGEEPERALKLAIVGRPNVGKSTLVNRLLGQERLLTGPEPGVTREAISIAWRYRDRAIRLIDTAGLRRRARVAERLEKLSMSDTLAAIRFAEVVVLVVDATEVHGLGPGLHKQDLAIGSMVAEEGRASVIAVNKWDLVADRKGVMARIDDSLATSLPQIKGVRGVRVSALEGTGLDELMAAVLAAERIWATRAPTGPLNRWLAEAAERHPPPLHRGRRVRLRYITQIKVRPPTFALFTSQPKALRDSYLRYLANGLREVFGLAGVPIRLLPRKGRNPYAKG